MQQAVAVFVIHAAALAPVALVLCRPNALDSFRQIAPLLQLEEASGAQAVFPEVSLPFHDDSEITPGLVLLAAQDDVPKFLGGPLTRVLVFALA